MIARSADRKQLSSSTAEQKQIVLLAYHQKDIQDPVIYFSLPVATLWSALHGALVVPIQVASIVFTFQFA